MGRSSSSHLIRTPRPICSIVSRGRSEVDSDVRADGRSSGNDTRYSLLTFQSASFLPWCRPPRAPGQVSPQSFLRSVLGASSHDRRALRGIQIRPARGVPIRTRDHERLLWAVLLPIDESFGRTKVLAGTVATPKRECRSDRPRAPGTFEQPSERPRSNSPFFATTNAPRTRKKRSSARSATNGPAFVETGSWAAGKCRAHQRS